MSLSFSCKEEEIDTVWKWKGRNLTRASQLGQEAVFAE